MRVVNPPKVTHTLGFASQHDNSQNRNQPLNISTHNAVCALKKIHQTASYQLQTDESLESPRQADLESPPAWKTLPVFNKEVQDSVSEAKLLAGRCPALPVPSWGRGKQRQTGEVGKGEE